MYFWNLKYVWNNDENAKNKTAHKTALNVPLLLALLANLMKTFTFSGFDSYCVQMVFIDGSSKSLISYIFQKSSFKNVFKPFKTNWRTKPLKALKQRFPHTNSGSTNSPPQSSLRQSSPTSSTKWRMRRAAEETTSITSPSAALREPEASHPLHYLPEPIQQWAITLWWSFSLEPAEKLTVTRKHRL